MIGAALACWDRGGEEGGVAYQRPRFAFQCLEVFPIHQLLGVVLLLGPPCCPRRLGVPEQAPDAAQAVGAGVEWLRGFEKLQEPPGESGGVRDRQTIA